VYRLKGELLLTQEGNRRKPLFVVSSRRSVSNSHRVAPGIQEAEACFVKALDVARRQHAKSLELRAATSVARLWQRQGKLMEARKLLSEVYHWFTEGFETKDLEEAKALLDELAANSPSRRERRSQ
jgi:adenylate cyclase